MGTDSGIWKGGVDAQFGEYKEVEVTIDNILQAATQEGGAAYIVKKGFHVHVVTIPEPGTILLLASGAALVIFHRRKRR